MTPMATPVTGGGHHAQRSQHTVAVHGTVRAARLHPQGQLPRLCLRQHAVQALLPLRIGYE